MRMVLIDITGSMELTGQFPGLRLGESYYGRVTASGGMPFYVYTVVAGFLPSGLSLDRVTGEVTGTPTSTDMVAIRVRATDLQGMWIERDFVIPGATLKSSVPPLSRAWAYLVVAASDNTDHSAGQGDGWTDGLSPFGNSLAINAYADAADCDSRMQTTASTLWPNATTQDIWVKQTVRLEHVLIGNVRIHAFADDTFRLWVNGNLELSTTGEDGGHCSVYTIDKTHFIPGRNLIVARMSNADGNAFATWQMVWDQLP